MSHRALSHLMVRMLYDPELVEAVYADPDRALADAGLDTRERGWLLATDPRAWSTDAHRRDRALTSLFDEYPSACAVAVRSEGIDRLHGYFRSAAFRGCVERRGSMAESFGRWLVTVFNGELAELARLELAVARVRRVPPPATAANADPAGVPALADPASRVRLADAADCCLVPDGTVERLATIRQRLAGHPGGQTPGIIDRELRLGDDPRSGQTLEAVIVDLGPEGPQLGFAAEPLVRLLEAARRPTTLARLWARARELGADPGDDREIVAGLVSDGLLVADHDQPAKLTLA